MTPRKIRPPTTPPKTQRKTLSTQQWNAIRRAYVRGGDEVTFQSLCAEHPDLTMDMVKKRSTREDWSDLRAEFRHQAGTIARSLDLESLDEVRKRHVTGAKAMQAIALKRLQTLQKDVTAMTPTEAASFYRLGTEIERKARGMEELTVRVEDLRGPSDLKALSNDQLAELVERRRAASGAKA